MLRGDAKFVLSYRLDQDYGNNDQGNNRINQARGSRVSVGARRGNAPTNTYDGGDDGDYNQGSNSRDYNDRQPSPNRGARVKTGPSNAGVRVQAGSGRSPDNAPIPRPRTQSAKGKGSIRMR